MKLRPVLIALAVTLPLVALFLHGMRVDARYIAPALPGQVAPDFALERMPYEEGGAGEDAEAESPGVVTLADHRGQVVVVNFWASWCLPCRYEHPDLVAAARAYGSRGVAFYGILYKDSPGNARRWLADMGGEVYPTLLDPGARTAIDYGLTGVPETVIIDGSGKVAYKYNGPVTFDMLASQIEPLLSQDTETKTEAAVTEAAS